MRTILVDPVTRIEGHLKIELRVENNQVREAYSSGGLYRGIEEILSGRHPLDAQRITTRVCGVCPLAHSLASAYCLESAFGISEKIPVAGQLLRNLIHGANFLHNHLLHFYHLSLLDYLDFSRVSGPLAALAELLSSDGAEDARFSQEETERMLDHYVQALEMRRKAHELEALLAGKMPHDMAIVPGGVTYRPGLAELAAYRFRLRELRDFLKGVYWPDVLLFLERYRDHFQLGRTENLLAYGGFPVGPSSSALEERLFPAGVIEDGEYRPLALEEITESVARSWYSGNGGKPLANTVRPWPEAEEGYSWLKAPRYRGRPHEVGPAARVRMALEKGEERFRTWVRSVLTDLKISEAELSSVAGRHLARALEAMYLAQKLEEWLDSLDLGSPVACSFTIPDQAEGVGVTEAARGAVGHWIRIEGKKIAHYQIISPTTWNASPRDERGLPGPLEQALVGTPVRGEGRLWAGRVVRSFDPCLACAVH